MQSTGGDYVYDILPVAPYVRKRKNDTPKKKAVVPSTPEKTVLVSMPKGASSSSTSFSSLTDSSFEEVHI